MKKILLNVFLSFLLGFTSISYAVLKKAETIDQIVAVVNDAVITQSELDKNVDMLKKRFISQQIKLPLDNEFRKQTLEQMIDRKLELQIAANIGIEIDDKELNAAFANMAESNHLTLKDFYANVKREGWKIDDFRKEIRDELTIQKLQAKEVASRVEVSEEEINDFLISESFNDKSYHLLDVLIELSQKPSSEEISKANNKALGVISRLKQKDITNLRQDKSLEINDLGFRKLNELPKVFGDEAKKMKEGEVRGPLSTPNGLHIIRLMGIQGDEKIKIIDESEIQMIFVSKSKKKERVDFVYKELKKGKIFEKLAKKYSNDKSAKSGGYIGWVTSDKFDLKVNQEISKLSIGDISKPIITDKGFYIVKMLAKRKTPHATDVDIKRARDAIFQKKLNEEMEKFIENLRKDAYIKIYNF